MRKYVFLKNSFIIEDTICYNRQNKFNYFNLFNKQFKFWDITELFFVKPYQLDNTKTFLSFKFDIKANIEVLNVSLNRKI